MNNSTYYHVTYFGRWTLWVKHCGLALLLAKLPGCTDVTVPRYR
jgi:hypothetical protein